MNRPRVSSLHLLLDPELIDTLPIARRYSPAPAYIEDDPPLHTDPRAYSQSSSSASTSTTPEMAKEYLSDLLQLPPTRAFPPALALQILTHKSYRYVHLIRHHPQHPHSHSSSSSSSSSPSPSPSLSPELQEWAANHNARLTFLGRRALASYLAMFVHSSIATSSELRSLDFLRGRSLENKLEAMRMAQNVGREVGTPWGVYDLMRWDRNEVGSPFHVIPSYIFRESTKLICDCVPFVDRRSECCGKDKRDDGGSYPRRCFHSIRISCCTSDFPSTYLASSTATTTRSKVDREGGEYAGSVGEGVWRWDIAGIGRNFALA